MGSEGRLRSGEGEGAVERRTGGREGRREGREGEGVGREGEGVGREGGKGGGVTQIIEYPHIKLFRNTYMYMVQSIPVGRECLQSHQEMETLAQDRHCL